jgi:hypothetical protein
VLRRVGGELALAYEILLRNESTSGYDVAGLIR